MLAAMQMLWRKYPNYVPNVVSLPNGANLKAFNDNQDFLDKFGEIILCPDNDEAGEKLVQEVTKLYPDIKIMTISEKDPNDMLLGGKQAEFINSFFQAKPHSPIEVVEGGVGLDRLKKPLEEGIHISSMPKLMKRLHGFREGEMTVILAPPGVGKTTICRDIGYYLNIAGEKIVNIYLEEDIEKSQQSYIALDNGVLLPKLRANPNVLTDAQWEDSYQKLIDNDRTMWVDHFGSINPDKLMQIVRYADNRGYKFVILDHISMVFSGMQTANERKEIDLLLTELASFTKGAHIHPIVVSHVRRTNKPLPKDGRGNIEYPYWDTVASDAARGSGAFEQLAWNIIAIEPEILESGERGRVRLKVSKNREWGDLGVCDIVKMDERGKLVDADEFNRDGI
jgi:twinkle protein